MPPKKFEFEQDYKKTPQELRDEELASRDDFGETPEEIAVSIAGEMICVRATRREAAGDVHHGCPMH